MNNKAILNTVLSATAGGVLGGVITYLAVKKHYQQWADSEVAAVRRHYALTSRKDELSINVFNSGKDEEVAEEVQEILRSNGYSEETDPSTKNIFDSAVEVDNEGDPVETEDDLTEEEDEYQVIPGEPNLISDMEFMQNEKDYDQNTLTYFVGDDTLADSNLRSIDDMNRFVGERHLDMFGEVPSYSSDPNILYIRNDELGMEFEIVRNSGHFTIEALGMDPEDVISDPPKKRNRQTRDDE